jgi:hypothetical protein
VSDEKSLTTTAFREAGLDPAGFTLVPKPGPPTPLRTHMSEDSVLTVALDPEGRRQNLIENACRRWAGHEGVRCPPVLGASPTGHWLHATRVVLQPPQGPTYVHAALDAADRLASSLPPALPMPATRWRASGASRLAPALRGVLGGLDLRRFLRARRAAAALNDLTTCHGDFYRRNVLFGSTGRVYVVDWEFVGQAPRWTDHLRFWSTLRRADDRAEAWGRIISDLSPGGVEHVRSLSAWLSHRLLAENLAAPPKQRDVDDLAHARRLVVETKTLIAELG